MHFKETDQYPATSTSKYRTRIRCSVESLHGLREATLEHLFVPIAVKCPVSGTDHGSDVDDDDANDIIHVITIIISFIHLRFEREDPMHRSIL